MAAKAEYCKWGQDLGVEEWAVRTASQEQGYVAAAAVLEVAKTEFQ